MDGPGIVYAGLYSIVSKSFFHLVPHFRPDYKQVIDRLFGASIYGWEHDVSHVFEFFSVSLGEPSSRVVPSLQSLQLDSANGRIDGVEPRCETYSTMVVFAVLVSTTISYAACYIGQFLVVCGYHSAVTAYGHVLCRIEGEASGFTDGTDPLSFEFSSMRLARIFDQAHASLIRNVMEFIYSRWVSVKVHWHYRPGLGANFCPSLLRTQVYS